MRRKLGRPLLAAVLVVACVVMFLTLGGGAKSKEYKQGWNYVVQLVKSGNSVGQSGAPSVICDAAAAAIWPSTYGVRTDANYRKYSDWTQGCNDALTQFDSGGMSGLQVPFN